METNNLIVKNNLILKFNKDHEYPLVHYRDKYNCLIHDKDTLYLFLTDTFVRKDIDINSMEWHDVINIEKNIYNFSNAYNYLLSNNKNINIHNSIHLEPSNIDMVFLIKYGKSVFLLTIYFFNIEKDTLVRLKNMPLDFRNKFYNFGNSLSDKIFITYNTNSILESNVFDTDACITEDTEGSKSIFTKIKDFFLGNKEKIQAPKPIVENKILQISTKDFLKYINLTEIIPSLMDEYIYENTTPDKRFRDFLNNLMVVFSVNQKE